MNAPRTRPARETADTIKNEEALIGSVLLNPELLDRLRGLDDAKFVDDDLGRLWCLLREMQESGIPIDTTILPPRIRAAGIDINAARLAQLFTAVPNPKNAFYYHSNVLETQRLRKLSEAAESIIAGVADATQSSESIVSDALTDIETLSAGSAASEPVDLGAAMEMVIEDLERPDDRRKSAMTGLPLLDEYLGGMAPGELHVIGARPSRGKTALGLQIALHNAKQDRRVLFCALEMTVTEMAKRVVCSSTDVDSFAMRTKQLNASEREQFLDLCRELQTSPLKIWSESNVTVPMIRHQAKTLIARDGLELIVLDYLGLMKATTSRPQARWETFTQISNALKSLAMDLGIPILALQQLGRDTEGRPPRLSDLRDSGSIEQDADAVILIDYGEKGEGDIDTVTLDLAKNRHGQTGPRNLKFQKSKTRFLNEQWT